MRRFGTRLVRQHYRNAASTSSTDSFIIGLYQGKLVTDHVFPYPNTLDSDQLENLSIAVDSAVSFFEEVNDGDENDKNMKISDVAWQTAKDQGMCGMMVPEKYGGLALSNTEVARLGEITCAYDLGFSVSSGAHQSIGYKAILLLGNEQQKEKYLPNLASGEWIAAFALTEPSTGSDAASVKTRAVLSDDGKHYIMNGSKIWISNGGICDVLTVFAKTPQTQADGSVKDVMSAFIVERAFGGVSNGPPENKMGIKCSNTAEVYFEDTKIPVENLIQNVGDGFHVAMEVLNNGRFGMSSGLCGTMRKCIQKAVDHASTRKQFFNTEIHNYGVIQEKIARMNMKLYAAESMAYLLCASMDNKARDYGLEAACCKIFSSEAAWWCCDEAIQILGGMGYMRETGLERILRDLRIFRIFEGTNDILRLFVALTGIKNLGKSDSLDRVKGLPKAMKNPLGNLSTVIDGVGFMVGHSMNENPLSAAIGAKAPTKADVTFDEAALVDPSLAASAGQLDKAIQDFQFTVQETAMNFQKKIINPENQMLVWKLADSTIGIYSCAAVLSRASRAVQRGDESAAHEQLMAKAYVKDECARIKVWLKEARANKSFHADMTKISQNIIANGGVVQPHPLGV